MSRKLKQVILSWWLLYPLFILFCAPAFAESLDIYRVLGLDKSQLTELDKSQPIAYDLKEGSSNELAVGVIWYFPVPLEKVVEKLRIQDPDMLDIDVTAHGILTEHSGMGALKAAIFSKEEALNLLEAEPGDEFNLSSHEFEKLKAFRHTLKRTPQRTIEDAAGEYFREILLQRHDAYRRGGINAISPYVRKHGTESKPSIELRQAVVESDLLSLYFPYLLKDWLDYPKALPAGASEVFPWIEKYVEGRSAIILRHRITMDWNGGVLVLTREYYTPHSYNSSQWITGCLPYREGTVVFQQVRSFTDQVAGTGSTIKHLVGRELLQDKMVKSLERLCVLLGSCT